MKVMDNKEWLKRARAKRIAKIQRRKRIDNYIRGRVYLIMMMLALTVMALIISLNETAQYQESMSTLHATMGDLLTKTADDRLLKQNIQFAKAVDSLQIMIFAYNRRHQSDAKTINALINKNTPKIIHSKLEFPGYIDSTKYDFEFDTIAGIDTTLSL